jgi:hypothetical protein
MCICRSDDSRVPTQKNTVMYPARPGTEKDYAGEWQQQFTRNSKYIQVDIKGASRTICPRPRGVSNISLFNLNYQIIFK